jgi:hypothetical protein
MRSVEMLMLLGLATAPAALAQAPDSTGAMTLPAPRKFDTPYRVRTEYDRFKNATFVSVELYRKFMGNPASSLFTDASWSYSGKTPGDSPPAMLFVFRYENPTGWQLLDLHAVDFVVDDSIRFSAVTPRHEGQIGSVGTMTLYQEQVYASIPVAQFMAIIGAQKVEGRVGTEEFKWGKKELEALRDLASRMAPPPR